MSSHTNALSLRRPELAVPPRRSGAFLKIWALALFVAAAAPSHAVYVEALTNGGFELSSGDASLTNYRIYPPHSPYVEVAGSNALASTTGWRTTAPDEAIEVWLNGFNGVSTSAGTGPAQGGSYFAEINANVVASLYQDVTFNVAAQVDYFFMHRARQGSDTMRFTVTNFGPDNTYGTADDSEVVSFAVTNNTTNEAGESNGWRPYFGNNVFNSIAGRKYRVELSAISTGSGSPSVGNFVDSVSFGAELETQSNFGPPTISDIPNQSVVEDGVTGTINFTVGDSVTPVNSLTVTAFSEDTSIVPSGNIVVGGSGANRTLVITPVANAYGDVTITVAVNDGSFSTIDTFVLTVLPVNDVPSFTKGANISINEDAGAQSFSAWIAAFSRGPANESVQTVSYNVSNNNIGLFSTQPSISSAGTLTFTPTANANGVATVTVSIQDNGGTANGGVDTSASQTFTITVNAVNDVPVATLDNYSTNEDTPLNVAAPGVLTNDTDIDGNPLTAVLVTGVSHGSLTLNANGSFLYTPTANYNGPDSFTYRANDGTANSNIVTVSITVNAINDAPVAVANGYSTNEDTALVVAASGVLGNDTDAEGNPLTAVLVSSVANGSLTLNANGSFTYTPNANYNGGDSFTYKANDGALDSNTVTVSITVNPVNDAPVAVVNSYTTNEDTALNVAAPGVLGNDTDVDGNPLTAVLMSGVSNGSLALNANGSFTYTPNANYNGPDSFTYRANDGTTNSNIVTVSITVDPVNDAPVAAGNSYTTNEDMPLTVIAPGVLGNDTDTEGNPLTAVFVANVTHGTLVLNANGSFTYTPDANYSGPDSFTYQANDGTSNSNIATVSITVDPVNDAPVAVADSYTTNEDTALIVVAPGVRGNDTDADGNPLTVALVAGPTHGSLTLNANGSFTYTPAANYSGPDSFTYQANDGTANSNIATVSITVDPVNDTPVAVADSYVTDEDTALTVVAPGVRGNDTDADGNPLTVALVAGPTHGSLTLNADGSFAYTPVANYNGPDSFTYQVNDGTVNSNIATVSLTVNPVNDAPVAVVNSYTTNEDAPLTVAGPGVLGNDTDVEGNPLTAVLVSGVSHGTLTLNPNGSFTYTPVANYNGPDSFTYLANDGTSNSNIVTVSLTVDPVNDTPVAVVDSYVTDEDTALTVVAPGVRGNDTDADGNPLTVALVAGPTHGSLTLNADGSFTYTPVANYNGPDSFTYQVNDGTVNSNIATVSLTVNPVNDAPVAVDNSYTTNEDTVLTMATPGVRGNDTDVDGNPLTVALVSGVSHGTLTLNADGSFTYTPAANYNGPDSFTYQVNDGTVNSNIATVSITVDSVNDVPVAVGNSYTTNEDAPLTVAGPGVLGNDTDGDGTPLTAVLVAGPTHGTLTLNPNGSFTYTPAANYNGPDSFTYQANDGTANSNIATVSLTVDPVNDVPVAVADSYTTNEDTVLTVTLPGVRGNDTDADGNPLTVTVVTGPTHGVLVLNPNGSFTYTPAANYNGPDSFTYQANDGTVNSNIATVSITVDAVNDVPVAVANSYTTNEDTALTVPAPGLIGNDTDTEGSTLTAALVTDVSHGTLTLNPDGSFTYTPAANYSGPDSFTYRVNDGTTNSNTATVTITVDAVNDVPVAVANVYTTSEDTTLNIAGPGILGNDTDGDGTPLTAILVSNVSHGTLVLNANGSFLYTPAANYHGPDSFTYQANDGTVNSNIATVSITVDSVNDAPVAVVNSYTVASGTLTVPAGGVLTNDTDADASPLTAVLVTGPSHGTLTLNANGSFTYTPTLGYFGTDSFYYKANDGVVDSNTAKVTIQVTSTNRPPVVSAPALIETVVGYPVTFPVGTSDPDSDPVTLTFGTPAHGTITGTGPYVYTPAPGYIGTDSFTVSGNDGKGHTTIRTVKVVVAAVPGIVGNYSLLLRDTAGEVKGHLVMTTTKLGRATGVATVGGIRYIVRGYFGGYQVIMYPRSTGLGSVALDLNFDNTNPVTPVLVVGVTDAQGTYTGRTVRSPYSTVNKAPQAGKYTIIVSRDPRVVARSGAVLTEPTTTIPTVGSVLTATVRTSGAVVFNGFTSHGYKLTCSSYIMPGSVVPFYAGRREPGASIQYSTFAFPDDPSYATVDPDEPAIHGTLRWVAGLDKRVTTPVDAEYAVLGAHYTPARTGVDLLGTNQLTLRLDIPTYATAGLSSIVEETRPFTGNLLKQVTGNISHIRVTFGSGAFIARVMGAGPRPIYGVIIQGEGFDCGLGTLLDIGGLGTCELYPAGTR